MDELELFLGRTNRILEQDFCRMFSEKNEIDLSFEHKNRAFTDGYRIVVDPQWYDLYDKADVLNKVEDFLKVPHRLAGNIWQTLKVFTRFQTIHECLHILYSEFRNPLWDPYCRKSQNRAFVMADIDNIIEDAYVDAVGASVYPNTKFYLRFGRALQQFVPQNPKCKDFFNEHPKLQNIISYLSFMTRFMLYPFEEKPIVSDLVMEYINKTKQLFVDGAKQSSPKMRYNYVRKIFKIIEPLIPSDQEDNLKDWQDNQTLLCDTKTHSNGYRVCKQGPKSQKIAILLWDIIDDDLEKLDEDFQLDLLTFSLDKNNCEENIPIIGILKVSLPEGLNLDCHVMHNKIEIKQEKYGSNYHLANPYNDIFRQNKSTIDNYISKLSQLLLASADVKEEKHLIGHGISSKNFADVKRRFWYKIQKGIDIPQLSILFLIDGSGSMMDIIDDVKMTSVIMHEVLQFHNIEHCFVEHRAIFNKPEIQVNILWDFDDKPIMKYNLLKSYASNSNRDSLALLWAERFLIQKASTENRIIISLSDGLPNHPYDDYIPPVSTQDTKNTIRKINKRGTKIIAVALDQEDSYINYENMRTIYPNLIGCNNIHRLPGQLFRIISKELEE